jgi:hypothetical protein
VPTCGPRGISAQRSAREATRHSPPSTSGRGAVRGGPTNLGQLLGVHCWQQGDALIGDPPHKAAG